MVQFDMHLEQMDVKITFLHGDLEETIYIDGLKGLMKFEKKIRYVCWNNLYMIWSSLQECDIKDLMSICLILAYNSCVYLKSKEVSSVIYLLLYVDDMISASASLEKNHRIKGFA